MLNNDFGKIGEIKNRKAAASDGANIRLPISRNSFFPGSKQPVSKLNEHLNTFSVVNLAQSCLNKIKINKYCYCFK